MTNKEKKELWLQYAKDVAQFHVQVVQYANSLPNDDEVAALDAENPQVPLPPKPPEPQP